MKRCSEYVLANGIRLNVHRFEPENAKASGLTVLLLHGFLDSGATWELVAEPLARAGHEVLAPDLRGFGSSDHVGAGGYYHFADYVGDVAALLDRFERKRIALVGHSMGGTVASLCAGAMPDRIERLALLEGLGTLHSDPATTGVARMRAWLRDMQKIERQQRPLASFEEAVERLARMHPSIPHGMIESRARLLTRVDDSGQLRWAYDPLHRTTSPTPFSADAFKGFLRSITVPTLFVSGGIGGWRVPDESERLACISNVTHVDLPDAGHMMHWKSPDAVAECLLRFLAS
ncbi:MAG: alpha/beta hydrolase [Polyangiaceae bacterium]|nr:alpha/beta hydrolase [Polyangiaceae bacterium]